MERSSEHQDLAVALAELRPEPRPAFTAELDERAAAGFPRRSRFAGTPLAVLAARLPRLSPRRIAFAGGGAALAAIAIATVVIANVDSESEPMALEQQAGVERYAAKPPVQFSQVVPQRSGRGAGSAASEVGKAMESSEVAKAMEDLSANSPSGANSAYGRLRSTSGFLNARHREIERSAQISLLAEPADVAEDSAAVFDAVHDARGIVLRSTTTSGSRAGAHFDLLIPSPKLGDALAAISAIDEVHSRREATDDITAPTVATGERLRDSRARIDGLLAQLSTAESEAEMEALEVELDRERRHSARLRAQLERLERRTDFSRVSVAIATNASSTEPEGSWGVGDAFRDAGHILGVAAGVTLIALAVIAPLALLGFLAWLAHRLWLRTRREQALDA